MTETEIYRNYLKKYDKFFDLTRIESGNTESGIPDIYYIGKSISTSAHGWIELKTAKVDKDYKIIIPYRAGQINWLSKHIERGLRAYTLIYFNNYFYLTQRFKMYFSCIAALSNCSIYKQDIRIFKNRDIEFVKTLLYY